MKFKVPRHLAKVYGLTVDGQAPCYPDCPPPAGCFEYLKEPEALKPRPPRRVCPCPEPRPGCYVHTPQPLNFINQKKYPCKYCPTGCDRPCCRHIVPMKPNCKYDDPCKAQCFNHPTGMLPSGRYPPDVFRGYMH